jgi:hypothetical protein
LADLARALHGPEHVAVRYRLLVFLGDTARYAHDAAAARHWYCTALHTDPHDGRALNQLGVLSMAPPSAPLTAAYYLQRALCATRPFSRAAMNLDAMRSGTQAASNALWGVLRADPANTRYAPPPPPLTRP